MDALCVLASLVTPGVGFSYEQLKTMPLTAQEVVDNISSTKGSVVSRKDTNNGNKNSSSSWKYLSKYCVDCISKVKNGQLARVVGFEREIMSMFEILGRKTKSNLLVVGEAGVGKTAFLRGFLHRIANAEVPESYQNVSVFEIDLGLLTAGTSYKGEVDDRVKGIFDELRTLPRAILIVESIDKVFDKQEVLYGMVNMLKRELSDSEISLVGTCSVSGYTKNIETDKEFTRLVDIITIEQPDEDTCFRILKGSIDTYAEYHGLTVSDEVLVEAVRLSKRYMTEKSLPDAAFDLIDRTMSQINVMNSISSKDILSLEEELSELEAKGLEDTNCSIQLSWLHNKIFSEVSCLLTSQIDTDVDFVKLESAQERICYLKQVLLSLKGLAAERRIEVQPSDLFAVVAKQTGIPLGKVQSKERDKLVNGEKILKRRVVGQDHAVKIVLDAIYESRSGMNKKGQPMGSFFFLGPTGTGKTELSKSLVEFLFGDERALIRFDMSEFKEE